MWRILWFDSEFEFSMKISWVKRNSQFWGINNMLWIEGNQLNLSFELGDNNPKNPPSSKSVIEDWGSQGHHEEEKW